MLNNLYTIPAPVLSTFLAAPAFARDDAWPFGDKFNGLDSRARDAGGRSKQTNGISWT